MQSAALKLDYAMTEDTVFKALAKKDELAASVHFFRAYLARFEKAIAQANWAEACLTLRAINTESDYIHRLTQKLRDTPATGECNEQ